VQGPVLREIQTWREPDLKDTAQHVVKHGFRLGTCDAVNHIHRPHAYVDSGGLGTGLVSMLRERSWPVTGINASQAAREPEKFTNARAEVYFSLRELLQHDRCALPRDPLLEEELLATLWQLDGKGRLQLIGKEEIRSAIGRSPDRADATALAFAHAIGLPRPTVAFMRTTKL
jgi:hypothetical protein